jgi:phytoene dehydrogenase-like protein
MMKKVPTARKRTPKYRAAKQKAAIFIINYLDQKYPGLKEKVEYTDVSTPLMLVRYTGNYKGSVLAWNPFGEAGETFEKYIKENGPVQPALKNFYLSGTWISTGGVIRAVTAGRHVMQFICNDDNKKFHACIPEVPQTIAVPHFTTEVAEVKKSET